MRFPMYFGSDILKTLWQSVANSCHKDGKRNTPVTKQTTERQNSGQDVVEENSEHKY